MSSISATFNTGFELIEGLHQFLIKGHTLPPVYSCVGGGYIDDAIGTSASTYELFKVSFSSPTDFSVSGTYNGAIGSGTVGNLFSSSVLKFTVTSAGAPFANGDYIQLQMTAPWQALNYSQGSSYVWRAPGNNNNYGPIVGVNCESNGSSNYYNATVIGYPTWQDNKGTQTQWKQFSGGIVPLGPASGQTCTLIARADGQFCYFVCLIGSTFTAGCMGFMDAFHSTDQHSQPLLLGSAATSQVQWSHSSVRSPMFAPNASEWASPNVSNDGIFPAYLYMFKPNGRWAGLAGCASNSTNAIDRYDSISIATGRIGERFQVNLDGSVPFLPIYLRTSQIAGSLSSKMWEQGYFGVVPFVKFMPCTNADGSLINGNTILRDNTTRRKIVTIQNGYVADVSNTYAFELA